MSATSASPAIRPVRGLWPFYAAGALDALVGLDLLLAGPSLAAWLLPGAESLLGVAMGSVLRALGVVLLLVGLDTVVCARSPGLRRFLPALVAAAWVWVTASALVLALDARYFSPAGMAAVALLACAVALLAVLQSRALRAAA